MCRLKYIIFFFCLLFKLRLKKIIWMTGKCYIKYAISFCLNIRHYAVYVDISHTHNIVGMCTRIRYQILYFIRLRVFADGIEFRDEFNACYREPLNNGRGQLYTKLLIRWECYKYTSSSVKNFLIHTIYVF